MRTIGTVNTSTKPAPISVPPDSLTALPKSFHFIRWRNTVTRHTKTRMPPGRYSGCRPPLMPASPRMPRTLKATDCSIVRNSGTVRLSTSRPASSR
jgi:hypothetical protein